MSFNETPIINSPFEEPKWHYELGEDRQPKPDKVPGRRPSFYYTPIVQSGRRGSEQLDLALDQAGGKTRVTENVLVNEIRKAVDSWRQLPISRRGVSPETQRLLEHWTDPHREKRLFFCQIEALETLIYLTEVDPGRFAPQLEAASAAGASGLFRMACKMATGSGKTTVMAMIIAWHAVNVSRRGGRRRSRRRGAIPFSDTFLVVAPGITIRDRLRVLKPQDPQNVYEDRDLVPRDLMDDLRKANIVVTNFHAFQRKYKESVSTKHREILTERGRDPKELFRETADEMVGRILDKAMTRRNIVVLNDEAHHCYRALDTGKKDRGDAEEKDEARKNREAAHLWIGGLEAVQKLLGVAVVYDLSATPFYLSGSGRDEGTLFEWVVSDFALMDAIECGIVKVPRIPTLDASAQPQMPMFRHLYRHVRDSLPRKGRRKQGAMKPGELHNLPLVAAMNAFYAHYQSIYDEWAADPELARPPVFIAVCNNTATSKLIFDWISGWEDKNDTGEVIQTHPGHLELFSNVRPDGRWYDRPRTILVDSEQLESDEPLSDDFKTVAAREIEDFKREKSIRGERVDDLTDKDILREVLNTVGKSGRLGADIRCVVSVSMLTEGWDANTVTHVLGVRAFGTQLLCEQVVGRALRRVSYDINPATGLFEEEYADVLGVPFDFAANPRKTKPVAPRKVTRIEAVKEREGTMEIRFPRVEGYRIVFPPGRLKPEFREDSRLVIYPHDIPDWTLMEPMVGEKAELTFDHEQRYRMVSVAYQVAGLALRTFFKDAEGNVEIWRFPDLLRITREWIARYLTVHGNPPQILRWEPLALRAAEKIDAACRRDPGVSQTLLPIVAAYNPEGSTKYVRFDTSKDALFRTARSHLNYVVCDSGWEEVLAVRLERMAEVLCYVKNHNLHFEIPYTRDGEGHLYRPDFIVHVDDGHGPNDPLKLVIEVKGEEDELDLIKTATAEDTWVTAVNNDGRFGRWAFLKLDDQPHNAADRIRTFLAGRRTAARAA